MSNTPTDLVQIWKDTFTLVFRQNVDRMRIVDACIEATQAAHLHVQNLKAAHLHVQNLHASDVTPTPTPPPPKAKVRIEYSPYVKEYYCHFDKQCSGTLIQYLKDSVKGIAFGGIYQNGYKLAITRADLFDHVSFLNSLKTAIETFFRKENMEVEYF
jgi:hypothetical protein